MCDLGVTVNHPVTQSDFKAAISNVGCHGNNILFVIVSLTMSLSPCNPDRQTERNEQTNKRFVINIILDV